MSAFPSLRFRQYGSAVLAIILATIVRQLLDPGLGDDLPFITYLVAILFAAWYGGYGPAILTLVSGAALSTYLFAPERWSLYIYGLEYQLGLALYVFVGVTAMVLNESLRVSHRRAEEARRVAEASEERFRAIYEHAAVGIVEMTPAGHVLNANAKLCEILGYSCKEMLQLSYPQWIHPEHLPSAEALISRLLTHRLNSYTQEQRYLRKDGRPIWVRVSSSLAQRGGQTVRIAVVEDISDRKQAEEELRALNASLEQRVAERTAVAEGHARQLRILASQLTQAEEQERRRLSQVLHDHLQQLLVAARIQLGRLRRHVAEEKAFEAIGQIDDLVNQSISESRSLTVELSPPVLYDSGLAAALAWLGRHTQEKHGLRVEVHCEPESEPVEQSMRVLLFQSVRELLFNVVKHAQATFANVRMARADGQLYLEVSDNGVGVDPNRLEPREGTGGGFGLFSVRERLELIGGRLEVDAAPGRGSRFVLAVPVEPAGTALAVEPPPTEATVVPVTPIAAVPEVPVSCRQPGKTIHVLLADDHPLVHKGLADLLREQPEIELVGGARDGEEVVQMAARLQPDVVVMDVAMPRLSGVEATRQIKSQQPTTCVIGLSMHEEEDMATAMCEAGAAAYLVKSDSVEKLLTAIRTNTCCQSCAHSM